MKYIEKIKLINFKRFGKFEYISRENRNIFIGDNEAGKSTILQAIDIVLTGSRSKVNTIGLESLFNKESVTEFLIGDRSLSNLPGLRVELYLSDHGEMVLEGLNNTDARVCHGLKLVCEPIDEYSREIQDSLSQENALFPYEYYSISFSTFSGAPYSQNRRFLNHIFIDSSLIGSELATRQYTKSVYEANTDITQRHHNIHLYRHSKANYTKDCLAEINDTLDGVKFEIKNDNKSNLGQDLMITKDAIPISQMGKGKQCFIKTSFALCKKDDSIPIDLVLLEEPENHLSHINMKKLINSVEEAIQPQIMIATHSNHICSRLDLHNASLLSPLENSAISLSDLPEDTADYFIKAPDNKILEFVLSEKVVLVEGDAEFMLMEGFYNQLFEGKPEDSNIHIISVGGTSFKRYLDIAVLLGVKTAVVRDNDGDYQSTCIDNYSEYSESNVEIFYDADNENRTTLEKILYMDNKDLCEELFSPGRRTLSVIEYMLNNKTDSAYEILKNGMKNMIVPDYMVRALRWIRE